MVPAPLESPSPDRFSALEGQTLRTRAARGTVLNAAFVVAVNALGVVKGVAVAAYLGAAEYGVWGLVAVSLGTLLWLAQFGIDDKYIQQDHADQASAFKIAFTLQCMLAAGLMLAIAACLPVFALAYDRTEIILPGLALALAMPAAALQTPLWVFYRRLEFARQRKLQLFDPAVSFLVTVPLAAAGLGVWSVVVGTLAGSWVAAAVAVRASPYPLGLQYERGALREYASFSWPLVAGSASQVAVTQVPMVVASRALGLASVGALTLAGNMSQFTTRVDEIVTQTLYPAICAAKDRLDVLYESFVKSNRLALLWAVPCGVAVALFAEDLVRYVLGRQWEFAVGLIQVLALTAAMNQIGFNWSAFFRARGETRPIAVAGAALLVVAMGVAVPLLASEGLDAFAYGMALATAVHVAARLLYLARLFPALGVIGHVARGVAPTVPAAAAVMLVRTATEGRGPGWALLELTVFGLVAVAATVLLERRLLGEAVGYLRRPRSQAGART